MENDWRVETRDETREERRDTPMSSILVVDDDLQVLDVMSEMLRLEGHDVTVAENGKEAVERVADCNFDLIINTKR